MRGSGGERSRARGRVLVRLGGRLPSQRFKGTTEPGRLQQRGIPPMIVDLLEQFGSAMRCHGAERLMFDKAAPI